MPHSWRPPSGQPSMPDSQSAELTAPVGGSLGAAGAWLAAWTVAVSGPVARVWDHGDRARMGAALLCVVVAAWLVVLRRAPRDVGGLVVVAAALGVGWAVTIPWLGRAPGIVAGAAALCALGALVERRPVPSWPARPVRVVVGPLVPVVAGQVVWAATGRPAPTLALFAGGVALLAWYQLAEWPGRCERRAGAAVVAGWWRAAGVVGELFPLGAPAGRARGPVVAWHVLAVVASTAAMVPVFRRLVDVPDWMVLDTNDFPFHIRFAVEETSIVPLDVPAPHPLFHLGVALLHPLLGPSTAAVVVVSAAVALTAAALITVVDRPVGGEPPMAGAWAASFAVVWILAESPTLLLRRLTGDEGPFAILHFWGSPTEVVMVPLAILTALVIGDMVERPDRYHARRGLRVGVVVLVVLTALAKPSLALITAPSIVLLVLVSPRWRAARPRQLLTVVVLPSVVMAVAQTLFLALGPVPTGRSGFAFAPFEVVGEVFALAGPDFWVLPLLMVVVWFALRPRLRTDPSFQVAVTGLLVALPPMLLLAETGPRADDGALLKLGFAAGTMVSVFLLRACWFELRARSTADRRGPVGSDAWRGWVALGFVVLIVAGGAVGHLQALGAVSQ